MSTDPVSGGNNAFEGQKFSLKGYPLSALKKDNPLLFDFFEKSGLKRGDIVYSTDVEKLKEAYGGKNGKLSVKEALSMGLKGTKDDIKGAIYALDQIENNDLPRLLDKRDADSYRYPTRVSDDTINYYDKNGKLLSSRTESNGQVLERTYLDGDAGKLAGTTVTKGDFKSEKTFKDGNADTPSQEIEYNGQYKMSQKDYHYDENGALNYTTVVKNGVKTTNIYDKGSAEPRLLRSVEEQGNIIKTTNYKYDGDKLVSEVVEGDPSFAKEGIATQTKTYAADGKTVKEVLNEKIDKSTQRIVYKDGKEIAREDLESPYTSQKRRNASVARVHVPGTWKHGAGTISEKSKMPEATTAEELLGAFLNENMVDAKKLNMEKLGKDLVKYNPSIFEKDGKVRDDVLWERLDLPTDVANQYKK